MVGGEPPSLQYLKALGAVGAVTLAAFIFTPVIGPHATALVFLLTIVVLALFVERGPTLFAAALSAVLWDYFFLAPVYAFRITNFEDVMLFGMYFVVALVLGHLTTRIRAQQGAERRREERATALYLLTRDLNETLNVNQMVQRAVKHVGNAFRAEVAVWLADDTRAIKRQDTAGYHVSAGDETAAAWVLEHRQRAGKYTDQFPNATGFYASPCSAAVAQWESWD